MDVGMIAVWIIVLHPLMSYKWVCVCVCVYVRSEVHWNERETFVCNKSVGSEKCSNLRLKCSFTVKRFFVKCSSHTNTDATMRNELPLLFLRWTLTLFSSTLNDITSCVAHAWLIERTHDFNSWAREHAEKCWQIRKRNARCFTMTIRSKSQEFTVHDRVVIPRVKRLVPIISVRILIRNSPSMTRVVSFRFIEIVQGR